MFVHISAAPDAGVTLAESKLLQLTLDERDAEAVTGALSIALVIVTTSKAGAAMQLASGKPELNEVLILKEASRLGCAVAELYGLPCPEHHGKEASRAQCVAAKVDALSRLARLAQTLANFSEAYRHEKIEAFSAEGSDWKPNFKN